VEGDLPELSQNQAILISNLPMVERVERIFKNKDNKKEILADI
jgi:hypothetical protein